MIVFYLPCNKQKKTWNVETDDSISLSTLCCHFVNHKDVHGFCATGPHGAKKCSW